MSFIIDSLFFVWNSFVSLIPFVVLLSLLIFIHEWGHFITARLCGVRVKVFSLGFGKKIFKKNWRGTDYCISLFPLGGYVKMFGDEYGKENEISEKDKEVSFLHKKLWQRTAIVIAGPLMNFVLAVIVFAGLLMYGQQKTQPVAGEIATGSQAETAGFSAGDHIQSVDGKEVSSWLSFKDIIFESPDKVLDIEVLSAEGQVKNISVSPEKKEISNKWGFLESGGVIEGLSGTLPSAVVGVHDPKSPAGLAGLKTFDEIVSVDGRPVKNWLEMKEAFLSSSQSLYWDVEFSSGEKGALHQAKIKKTKNKNLAAIGLNRPELFVSGVKEGGPADQAGLKRGDYILSLNGVKVKNWDFLIKKVNLADNENKTLEMKFKREGKIQIISVSPERYTRIEGGQEVHQYMLGVMSGHHYKPAGEIYVEKYYLSAGWMGFKEALEWCAVTGMYVKKLLTGDVSRRTLGGAIAIGRAAYDSYSYGLVYFFKIMAVLSIQLFLINLLPIPVLDGGHLLFYVFEFFNGGPLSMKKMIIAQQMGLIFILSLVLFTTFNDLDNWLNLW